MSVTYRYRVSVPLPAANIAISKSQATAVRPAAALATSGMSGALAGTAGGVALGVGAAGIVPGIDLGVLIAMGVLFGAFNGGLFGLLTRLRGR
jgi:hypothetical protein